MQVARNNNKRIDDKTINKKTTATHVGGNPQ